MKLTDEQASLLEPIAASAATTTYRRVSDGLGWADLKATALLWAVAHPRKATEYLGHEDERQGTKLLLTAMCNEAMRATQKERATRIGYRVSDLYFYTAQQIREELLPAIWDRDSWSNPPVRDDQGESRGKGLANEGGNWMAMLADVADSVRKLPTDQKSAVFLHFGLGWTYLEVAADSDQTEDQVKYLVDKAVKGIHHRLGGDKPGVCEADCECKVGPVVAPRQSSNRQRLAELEQDYG